MPRKKKTALADGLYFVVSNGPKPPSDPAVRTIIRRQAMRDVGVGRKVRNAEKKLAKTCPAPKSRMPDQLEQQLIVRGTDSVSARSTESPGGTGSTPDVVFEEEWNPGEECEFDLMANWSHAPHDSKDFSPSFITLPVPTSCLTGYEDARVRFGIDLSMLDRLTSFSVGKTTMGQLAEDPSRMFSLVLDSKPENTHSYLALVPKRYEETIDADLVCAVQMMTLNELLDPSRIDAYANHVAGSTRLMKHRSPRAFKDEFEKALFHSHVGPVVSEALHNNTHCYLAEPEWTELYESLATGTDELTERHELVINARKLIFPLPGLWYDISKALTSQPELDEDHFFRWEQRCRALDSQYAVWREIYREYSISRSLSIPSEQEINIRRETYGQALESHLIVKMLLGTVTLDATSIAEEIRILAKQIMDLQKQPGPKHSWLFTGQEVGVAQVAMATSDNFLEDLDHLPPEERLAKMQKRYVSWSGMLRGS